VTGLASSYLTDGQQTFFSYTNNVVASGTHWRLSPQGYYYWGPFGLLGEYVISDQEVRKGAVKADIQNTAWQVAAGWVLTGEDASYAGVTPRHPFDPRANRLRSDGGSDEQRGAGESDVESEREDAVEEQESQRADLVEPRVEAFHAPLDARGFRKKTVEPQRHREIFFVPSVSLWSI
jgi:hypothetical protein